MVVKVAKFARGIVRRFGYDVVPYVNQGFPEDFLPADIAMYRSARPYSQTGPERLYTLAEATRYIVRNNIPGDLVECGVFRGGSVLAMIRTLQELGCDDRNIWLYDTFEGMPQPSDIDVNIKGQQARDKFVATATDTGSTWCAESLETVQRRIYATGYPRERLMFVKGKVEDTIPAQIPSHIALLRLDTDWYDSTRHELLHLFPLLATAGVLIIDDYGHWEGARRAVDEYFGGRSTPILLNRVDYSARIAVKLE